MRGMRALVVGGILLGVLSPGGAWAAACAPDTPRARFTVADVVFDGVVRERPSASETAHGATTFTVRQWHKPASRSRPAVVTLQTTAPPREGDVWRVYAVERDGALVAGACSGTGPLASMSPPPSPDPGPGFTGALAVVTAGVGISRRRRHR